MRFGVALLIGAIFIIGFGSGEVHASAGSWVSEPIRVVSETVESMPTTGELSCAGSGSRIQMVDEEVFRAACVYGAAGKPRVARLVNQAGQFEYAISYAHERNFYPIQHFCTGLNRCIYSQAEDALLHQALLADGSYTYRLINNFSQQVQRTSGEQVSYRVEGLKGRLLQNGAPMTTVALSLNGKWAVIELPRKGLVRLDLHTGKIEWIASLEITGASPQPVLGLAISSDGRWVAMTGWRQGLTVYEVNDSCAREGELTDVVHWCAASSIVKAEVLPGYVRAYRPIFSGNGMRISLVLVKQQGLTKVTLAPTSQFGGVKTQYIALGDSYTSGEGELADSFYLPGTNTSNNHCHVSNRSYPLLLGEYWGVSSKNEACSGSRMPDVRATLLQMSDSQPALVSLSIGGNDVGLISKLKSCLGPGTCEWAKEGMRLSTAQEMKQILPELVQLIGTIRESTGATVFVVGYPSILNTEASGCDGLTASLLSVDERRYIEASLQYLNTIVQSAAKYADATYVDITNALVGERLCEGGQKAMNSVRIGDDIAPFEFFKGVKFIGAESFHPTPFGHEKVADAIRASYGAFWTPVKCGSCTAPVDYPSYWTQGGVGFGIALTQIAGNFLREGVFNVGESFPISFPTGTFSPNTPVRVELRSDTSVLGEYVASDDGSFEANVTLPTNIEGYHVVHVLGTTRSGEEVDIYQGIDIEPPKLPAPQPTYTHTNLTALTTSKLTDSSTGLARVEYNAPESNQLAVRGAQTVGVPREDEDAGNVLSLLYWALGSVALFLLLIFLLLYRRKV